MMTRPTHCLKGGVRVKE